jgi:uncharacterized membrane protein
MNRQTHILNAASNLLGIALLIITGLNITKQAASTYADEVAWFAALCFATSCLLSYLSLRRPSHARGTDHYEFWADRIFLAGVAVLFVSVFTLAMIQWR